MKKNTLLSSLFTLLLLVGCSSDETTNTEKETPSNETATSTQAEKPLPKAKEAKASDVSLQPVTLHDISFTVPSSFTESEKKEGLTLSYVLYDLGDGASLNVVMENASEFDGLTLESYVEASNAFTGYAYKSSRFYELNGNRWSELISDFNGLELQQSTVSKDGLFYTFTYGALPEDINKHLKDVQQVIQSVKLK